MQRKPWPLLWYKTHFFPSGPKKVFSNYFWNIFLELKCIFVLNLYCLGKTFIIIQIKGYKNWNGLFSPLQSWIYKIFKTRQMYFTSELFSKLKLSCIFLKYFKIDPPLPSCSHLLPPLPPPQPSPSSSQSCKAENYNFKTRRGETLWTIQPS